MIVVLKENNSNAVMPRKIILDIENECTVFEDWVRHSYPVFEHNGYEVASSFINALTHWEEMEECIQSCLSDYIEIYKAAPPFLWLVVEQFVRRIYYKLSVATGPAGWITYQSYYNVAKAGGLLLEFTESRKGYIDVCHSQRRQY